MNTPDDLQKRWQKEETAREDPMTWKALIQEKRAGWHELLRAEDQGWYLAALCLGPLTAWAAWKAKYPWVQAGYGLMAATVALLTIVTWIAGRQRWPELDRDLREHLETLVRSYDRRARLIRGGQTAMLALSAGLVAIVMGIPGNAGKPQAWAVAALLAAGANIGQWLNCKRSTTRILRKRAEAMQLLQSLLAEPHDPQ